MNENHTFPTKLTPILKFVDLHASFHRNFELYPYFVRCMSITLHLITITGKTSKKFYVYLQLNIPDETKIYLVSSCFRFTNGNEV